MHNCGLAFHDKNWFMWPKMKAIKSKIQHGFLFSTPSTLSDMFFFILPIFSARSSHSSVFSPLSFFFFSFLPTLHHHHHHPTAISFPFSRVHIPSGYDSFCLEQKAQGARALGIEIHRSYLVIKNKIKIKKGKKSFKTVK